MTETTKVLMNGEGDFDDLTSIFSMSNHRKYTGALYIEGEFSGIIYYLRGEIVHAVSGEQRGKNGFHQLMRGSLRDAVQYQFIRGETTDQNSISDDHDTLLFSLAKIMDEADERERRIQAHDPTALSLGADPDVLDGLEVFKDVPTVGESEHLSIEDQTMQGLGGEPGHKAAQPQVQAPLQPNAPLLVEDTADPQPARIRMIESMGNEFWNDVVNAVHERMGSGARTYVRALARKLAFEFENKAAQVPVEQAGTFLEDVWSKAPKEMQMELRMDMLNLARKYAITGL